MTAYTHTPIVPLHQKYDPAVSFVKVSSTMPSFINRGTERNDAKTEGRKSRKGVTMSKQKFMKRHPDANAQSAGGVEHTEVQEQCVYPKGAESRTK